MVEVSQTQKTRTGHKLSKCSEKLGSNSTKVSNSELSDDSCNRIKILVNAALSNC